MSRDLKRAELTEKAEIELFNMIFLAIMQKFLFCFIIYILVGILYLARMFVKLKGGWLELYEVLLKVDYRKQQGCQSPFINMGVLRKIIIRMKYNSCKFYQEMTVFVVSNFSNNLLNILTAILFYKRCSQSSKIGRYWSIKILNTVWYNI